MMQGKRPIRRNVRRVNQRAKDLIRQARTNKAAQRRVEAGNKRARETLKKLF